jgi:preprotein translocase subunit SecE
MFQKVSGFFSEIVQELKKVTWPPRSEVFQAGMVVVIATAFLALLIFVIDLMNSTVLGFLIRRG